LAALALTTTIPSTIRTRIDGGVLEYGVGNGRVALALARAGVNVTGVDSSGAMLDDFATRLTRQPGRVRERVRLIHGDMRTVRAGARFELVIAPFNTVQHLYTARDFQRFLARVREHLTPDGSLVFDFSLPRPSDLTEAGGRPAPVRVFRHPRLGCQVRYSETFRYDPISQILHTTMHFVPGRAERPFHVVLSQRQWFPREVEALLHYAGFAPIRFLADFDPGAGFQAVDSVAVRTRLEAPQKPGKNPGSRAKSGGRAPLHGA
jgi:SAM-dependent methyltransferase